MRILFCFTAPRQLVHFFCFKRRIRIWKFFNFVTSLQNIPIFMIIFRYFSRRICRKYKTLKLRFTFSQSDIFSLQNLFIFNPSSMKFCFVADPRLIEFRTKERSVPALQVIIGLWKFLQQIKQRRGFLRGNSNGCETLNFRFITFSSQTR